MRNECLMEYLQYTPSELCRRLSETDLRSDGIAGYLVGPYWNLLRSYRVSLKTVVCLGDCTDVSMVESLVDGLCLAVHGIEATSLLLRIRCPLAVAEALEQEIASAQAEKLLPETAQLELGEEVEPYRPLEGGAFALLQSPVGFSAITTVLNGGELSKPKKPLRQFYLRGDVNHSGEILVPEQITLREILYGMGCGMKNNRSCKAIQIGGPSSGCLTGDQLDLKLDFKTLKGYGIRRGNSIITILDDQRCMVDATYRFMEHTQSEFCGKCVPCREGTRRMTEIFRKLVRYEATPQEFEMLLDLRDTVTVTSFCPLGKGSGSMLETARKVFATEFDAHLHEHRCPLCDGQNKRLESYPDQNEANRRYLVINPAICVGCSRCEKNCHAEAIHGELRKSYQIDLQHCVKCYACMDNCAFGAIEEVEYHG